MLPGRETAAGKPLGEDVKPILLMAVALFLSMKADGESCVVPELTLPSGSSAKIFVSSNEGVIAAFRVSYRSTHTVGETLRIQPHGAAEIIVWPASVEKLIVQVDAISYYYAGRWIAYKGGLRVGQDFECGVKFSTAGREDTTVKGVKGTL